MRSRLASRATIATASASAIRRAAATRIGAASGSLLVRSIEILGQDGTISEGKHGESSEAFEREASIDEQS